MTSSAGTAYIAEVSPAASRGAMIGIYQNSICIAIVLAALLNYVDKEWSNGWRISLGLQLLMGLAVTIGLVFVPETPRFLAKAGNIEDAKAVMLQLRGDEATAQAELDGVLADIAAEQAAGQASWREILVENPTFRNVVLIGCGVQFAQIITGINALVSFSGTMFRQLGVSGLNAAVLPFVAFLIGSEFTSVYCELLHIVWLSVTQSERLRACVRLVLTSEYRRRRIVFLGRQARTSPHPDVGHGRDGC